MIGAGAGLGGRGGGELARGTGGAHGVLLCTGGGRRERALRAYRTRTVSAEELMVRLVNNKNEKDVMCPECGCATGEVLTD